MDRLAKLKGSMVELEELAKVSGHTMKQQYAVMFAIKDNQAMLDSMSITEYVDYCVMEVIG